MDFFRDAKELIVQQDIEPLQLITGWETNNTYKILDSAGLVKLKAKEDTHFLYRIGLGGERPFIILVNDLQNKLVLKTVRPFMPNMCGFRYDTLDVFDDKDGLIGSVKQLNCGCCKGIQFGIFDKTNQHVLTIFSPCCTCTCFREIKFIIKDKNDQAIGSIAKRHQWNDVVRNIFTNADTFLVNYDTPLEPDIKAIIFCATFLIDFVFFSRNIQTNNETTAQSFASKISNIIDGKKDDNDDDKPAKKSTLLDMNENIGDFFKMD